MLMVDSHNWLLYIICRVLFSKKHHLPSRVFVVVFSNPQPWQSLPRVQQLKPAQHLNSLLNRTAGQYCGLFLCAFPMQIVFTCLFRLLFSSLNCPRCPCGCWGQYPRAPVLSQTITGWAAGIWGLNLKEAITHNFIVRCTYGYFQEEMFINWLLVTVLFKCAFTTPIIGFKLAYY